MPPRCARGAIPLSFLYPSNARIVSAAGHELDKTMRYLTKPLNTIPLVLLGVLCGTSSVALAQSAGSDELAEIRSMVEAMKTDYETRIAELEARLAAAEQSASRGSSVALRGGSVSAGNAFNPQISVILDGNYYHDELGGEGAALIGEAFQPSHPGHGHDEHEHGGGQTNGMNLRTAEFAFTATVDPYFDASAFIAIEGEDIHLEEGWFATRALPYGLRLKGGKFLSDVGYLNNKHEHQWDFADQNLAYLNLLGDHGLQDTGVQLTWLPDLPVYTLLGAELLQGDQERVGAFVDDADERSDLGLADQEDGPRMFSVFAKLSPELGYDHTLQVGGWYAHNRQHQEIHDEALAEVGLEGQADLYGLDLVYKYDNAESYGKGDLSLQAEYLRSVKDLTVRGGDPLAIGESRKLTTDGLYVQGLYGFRPRWQAGLRYDALGLTNKVSGDASERFDSSDRWTAVLTWTPTEFSRFRMQYSYNDILTEAGTSETFNTIWLQFLMSLGTHGAHQF